MKVLGLIPARGGSVRLPNKNICTLGGDPLVGIAIDTAKRSRILSLVVVSTDCPNIAEVSRVYGADFIIHRPSELAQSDTPMLPVVQHALRSLPGFDVVVLLQPTSPLREEADIVRAFNLFKDTDADAVISVTQPSNDMVFELGHANRIRASKKAVIPNGAIYIARAEHLLTLGMDWYTGVVYAYKMKRETSLDIDTEFDLDCARVLWEKINGRGESGKSSEVGSESERQVGGAA